MHASFFSTLSRLHDPILEESHAAPSFHKEAEEGNLEESLKSLDEASSKDPHGQLFTLLTSFLIPGLLHKHNFGLAQVVTSPIVP